MNLGGLEVGDKAVIVKVKGHGAFRKRITEMGFVKGKEVEVIKKAPLQDPVEYKLLDYHVSLRRAEATMIEVVTLEEAKSLNLARHYQGTINGQYLKLSAHEKRKTISIALVGNPNCGKTTLFNVASGGNEHVGNYSGVTVDMKRSTFKYKSYQFHITDLPGTYSLSTYTPEERYVRNFLLNELPDVVVNVVDSSNLERNLYLTSQLIDMDIQMVCALNMYDELEATGGVLDYAALGGMLGIPFVPTVGNKGKGIDDLFDAIIKVYESQEPRTRHIHINYGETIESGIKELQDVIRKEPELYTRYSPRYLSLKLLEKDLEVVDLFQPDAPILNKVRTFQQKIESEYKDDPETIITDARYGFVAGALSETFNKGIKRRRKTTEIIDKYVTQKYLGYPIFLAIMFIMFYSTFTLGDYPIGWIEQAVSWISIQAERWIAPGIFKDLLIDGIIAGVGGVIVFLPNILILFLFISFMEGTGYMARAAFIMDKLMHRIGLHGKSFIPLVMGFGCNVPAIMATRTIENRNDRLLTMLINPFMSCSARLPVYILIIGAFFPSNPGSMLFLMYLSGILIAMGIARLFKKSFFKREEAPFVMELPPYRMPTFKATMRQMWDKTAQYLKKMGGIILVASIIIWALGYFPQEVDFSRDYDVEISLLEEELDIAVSAGQEGKTTEDLSSAIFHLEGLKKAEHQERSYIGQIGHFIEPVMRPLGFDWKMSVSLLAGVAAKEIVISTMAVLYLNEDLDIDEATLPLQQKLRSERYVSGKHVGELVYNQVVALGFLFFILIYFPCVAVIAAIRKESGSAKWALFTIFYTTALAYLFALVIYQVGSNFF